jgi:hypothetical protein
MVNYNVWEIECHECRLNIVSICVVYIYDNDQAIKLDMKYMWKLLSTWAKIGSADCENNTDYKISVNMLTDKS